MDGRRSRFGVHPKKPSAEPFAGDDQDHQPAAAGGAAAADNGAGAHNNDDVLTINVDDADTEKLPTTAKGVLKTTIAVRVDTKKATDRILRDLETIKHVEEEALTILHKDLQKIHGMEADLSKINDTMGRAKEQITALGRRLIRDGCFKIMVTLLLCAIVIVIVLVVTDSFGKLGFGGDVTVINTPSADATTTTTKAP